MQVHAAREEAPEGSTCSQKGVNVRVPDTLATLAGAGHAKAFVLLCEQMHCSMGRRGLSSRPEGVFARPSKHLSSAQHVNLKALTGEHLQLFRCQGWNAAMAEPSVMPRRSREVLKIVLRYT